MKKAGRIATGILLGIAFTGAVGVYCWQYNVGGIQQYFTEQEEESETVKQPQIKVAERKIYEIGDEIECNGLKWKFTSAEIIEDYNSLDEYYRTREKLKTPSEWIRQYFDRAFVEDMRFLVLKAELTNSSEVHKEYTCMNMRFYNAYEDDSFSEVFNTKSGADIKCTSKTGEIKQLESAYDSFSIEGGETVELEYVIQYSEAAGYNDDCYIYDLYLSTLSLSPNIGYTNGIDNKIHLNINPKHMGINQAKPENTYDNQRNIPEMKCRQWTNLDMKNYQKEGYPRLYQKEGTTKQFEEEVTEENYLYDRGLSTQITNIQTVDWEFLPKDFVDRGALKKMADRYEQSYGYSQDQMKILILDMNMTRQASEKSLEEPAEESNKESSPEKVRFYSYTYLYTRDENEKRWVFGTADDWLVTENGAVSGQTGHINTDWFLEGQSVKLQIAYLLPPEIYNEGVLYFNGGEYVDIDFSEQPIQKINLK